ncbi:MAG: rhodanese-like domain-containing protein [Pseudomonadota bacterium]
MMITRRALLATTGTATALAATALPAFAAQEVSARQAFQLLQANPSVVILDIRTPREFNGGHIEGSININYFDRNFRNRIAELDPNRTYLMHCAAGGRSDASIRILRNAGLTQVYHMGGGTSEWRREGFPLVR